MCDVTEYEDGGYGIVCPRSSVPGPASGRDVLRALIENQARVRVYDGQRQSVRAEGTVIGYVPAPTLVIRLDDGTLVHESSALPREVLS